jgi:flagella basal body P-ring formation protein FlgA
MRGLLTLALLALATPALAGAPVSLKANVSNIDGVVTLGDLFDGAGRAASIPVAGRSGTSVSLNAAAVQAAARRAGLDWANAEGFKTIIVRGPALGQQGAPGAPAAAKGNLDVLTYARNLAAGETVQPADVIWGKAAAAPADAPADAEAVIGLAAKRPLRAGAAVAVRDVAAPVVIKAGDMLTVTYADGGITLALQAKAVKAGGKGDVIEVQNLASKKNVQAVVTGPGQAVVGPGADDIKAGFGSTRIASR